MIGPITVVSEGSIGSNTRRHRGRDRGRRRSALVEQRQSALDEAARLLRVEPERRARRLRAAPGAPAAGRQGAPAPARRVASTPGPTSWPPAPGRGGRGPGDGLAPDAAARPGPGHLAPGAGPWPWWRARPTGPRWPWRWPRATARRRRGHGEASWRRWLGGGGGGSPELAVAGGRDPSQDRRPAGRGRRRLGALTPVRVSLTRCGWLGIDLGARRIGVAVSDGTGTLASPRCTVERSGDADADRASAGGRRPRGRGPASGGGPAPEPRRPAAPGGRRAARRRPSALGALLAPRGVAVETFDERLTTVSAERSLAAAGRCGPTAATGGRPGRGGRAAAGVARRPSAPGGDDGDSAVARARRVHRRRRRGCGLRAGRRDRTGTSPGDGTRCGPLCWSSFSPSWWW